MHHDALQLKQQQQQEWLSYLNHISIDVVIDELPQVYSDTLQLKRRVLLLIDFNELSLKQQMSSNDAMLIGELQHVHNDALQLKQQQQELLGYLNHISPGVMIDGLPQVDSDALQLKEQAMLLNDSIQPPLQPQVLSSELLLMGRLRRVHQTTL